ncbi:MAG: hypothetical protein JW909_11630 [Planctomycetes bacterium]|nr:hypothetical protein [Planctomycetota bacterium]
MSQTRLMLPLAALWLALAAGCSRPAAPVRRDATNASPSPAAVQPGGPKPADITPPRPEPASPPKIGVLLTGYEPFGGAPFNTSWEVIRDLDGEQVAGRTVRTLRLPVVWQKASDVLSQAIASYSPEVVICLGMGTETVQVERVARNERRRYRDNSGDFPADAVIRPAGPQTYRTTLPVSAVVDAFAAQSLVCRQSDDAGGYLCNEAFYTCMAESSGHGASVAGFIHVPVIPPDSPLYPEFERRTHAAIRQILRGVFSH